jgi:exo-beta-1,3-glucanase (GH17 family)
VKHFIYIIAFFFFACSGSSVSDAGTGKVNASVILGNPDYQAICYGGYRTPTREVVPTVAEIKEDMRILSAMKIKIVRTYNVHFKEVANLLAAIDELKKERSGFEMYVMLGAWIDCKNAWTANAPIHDEESERNAVEIEEAVRLANAYPDIVKIIAVGNEAMVKWATSYYVSPGIILKWVDHLQGLKKQGKLPKDLWITSSDNFASWGGGGNEYHVPELNALIKAVDYISLHTYPMHDTHYNPAFWGINKAESSLSAKEKIDAAMLRARDYAMGQYDSVVRYIKSIGVNKPVHIGETGWASASEELYGNKGSKATDEYKAAWYYQLMRARTDKEKITCFYFEAFDENWKNASNPMHSENHFGLINLQGQAKYALWGLVDQGVFNGLTRNGKPVTKSYGGNEQLMFADVAVPDSVLDNP